MMDQQTHSFQISFSNSEPCKEWSAASNTDVVLVSNSTSLRRDAMPSSHSDHKLHIKRPQREWKVSPHTAPQNAQWINHVSVVELTSNTTKGVPSRRHRDWTAEKRPQRSRTAESDPVQHWTKTVGKWKDVSKLHIWEYVSEQVTKWASSQTHTHTHTHTRACATPK